MNIEQNFENVEIKLNEKIVELLECVLKFHICDDISNSARCVNKNSII